MEQKPKESKATTWIEESDKRCIELGIKIVDKSKDNQGTFVYIPGKHLK